MPLAAAARVVLLSLAACSCAAAAPAGGACPAAARAAPPRSFPFAPSGELRRPSSRDALPPLFADGLPCSTGCRAPGAVAGWPLRPFGRPHLLRAGLNELRAANLHLGVDIFARDGSPVYALQPGPARILQSRGRDARVQGGRFIYWHVRPRVSEGQLVRSFRDVVGTVLPGEGHVHLSELVDGRFLNPLRPGGFAPNTSGCFGPILAANATNTRSPYVLRTALGPRVEAQAAQHVVDGTGATTISRRDLPQSP